LWEMRTLIVTAAMTTSYISIWFSRQPFLLFWACFLHSAFVLDFVDVLFDGFCSGFTIDEYIYSYCFDVYVWITSENRGYVELLETPY
jgi:hypothetical protein